MSSDLSAPSYIGVDGGQIAYHRFGHGPSVVLIHGIPTWSYLWRNVVPPLIGSGLEIIAVDLLGYGDSDKSIHADLGVAAQAERLTAALRKLNWRGRAIVGHDIGGGVAQLMCANDLRRQSASYSLTPSRTIPSPSLALHGSRIACGTAS
jgi:2-hydroxymuconate-semialdehyde hydrolase